MIFIFYFCGGVSSCWCCVYMIKRDEFFREWVFIFIFLLFSRLYFSFSSDNYYDFCNIFLWNNNMSTFECLLFLFHYLCSCMKRKIKYLIFFLVDQSQQHFSSDVFLSQCALSMDYWFFRALLKNRRNTTSPRATLFQYFRDFFHLTLASLSSSFKISQFNKNNPSVFPLLLRTSFPLLIPPYK